MGIATGIEGHKLLVRRVTPHTTRTTTVLKVKKYCKKIVNGSICAVSIKMVLRIIIHVTSLYHAVMQE